MIAHKKIICITGCGSGFGKDSAIALAKRGHRVIATTEFAEEARMLNSYARTNNLPIESFKMDITNQTDREQIKNYDIDILINNAGNGESGPLAEIPMEKVRRDFEVNVFGALALAQMALRKMIEKDKGTVLFISSLAGRIGIPFYGSYSMTKFALCGGVPAMQREIYRITKNVHAVLIEPGAYHTGFNQKNIAKQFAWIDERSHFFKIKENLRAEQENYFRRYEVLSTKSLVDKIIKACEAEKPHRRYSAPMWQNLGIKILRIFTM